MTCRLKQMVQDLWHILQPATRRRPQWFGSAFRGLSLLLITDIFITLMIKNTHTHITLSHTQIQNKYYINTPSGFFRSPFRHYGCINFKNVAATYSSRMSFMKHECRKEVYTPNPQSGISLSHMKCHINNCCNMSASLLLFTLILTLTLTLFA